MIMKKMLTNFRILLLMFFILCAVISIHPSPSAEGVAIRNIEINSSASLAGIESPKPTLRPMAREVILSIDQRPVDGLADYEDIVNSLDAGDEITVRTNKGIYNLVVQPIIQRIELDETENVTVEEEILVNKTVNGTEQEVTELVNVTKEMPVYEENIIGVRDIGLDVYDAPMTNLKKGLDIQGGTRVMLEPEDDLSADEMSRLIFNLEQRLNVYGLSDIVLRKVDDISGDQFILVEIAGANEEEVKELIARQGKFEAKIGNQTIFKGGKEDDYGISYVCHSADCSGLDPMHACQAVSDSQYMCRFNFAIAIKEAAAQKQADVTADMPVIIEEGYEEGYLEEKLMLYLDDALVDELMISEDLKGRVVTDIAISGSGTGATEQEAAYAALESMKRLQTILDTGSLSTKLNIVKTDSISPMLGEEFLNNSILIGLLALLSVTVVVFIRYRKLKVAVPMAATLISEVILILGFASLVGWNLDLAAIAGIIIAVGTGVDHLIVIADETLRGEGNYSSSWQNSIKRAFAIIMAAYLTTFFGMIPLLQAGAGLLKGFALVTIVGLTIGVLVARPAYAAMLEILVND